MDTRLYLNLCVIGEQLCSAFRDRGVRGTVGGPRTSLVAHRYRQGRTYFDTACCGVVYRPFIAQVGLIQGTLALGSEASGLQPVGRLYHHQMQKYLFRVSESLKIETGSQQDTTNRPAIGCPTFDTAKTYSSLQIRRNVSKLND